MKKCIAHFGTFDVPNFGDLLFPLILERRLADLGCEWVHVSPRGGPPVWSDCVPTISIDALLRDPSALMALVVGGGNLVNYAPTTLANYQQGELSAVLAYPRLWLEPAYLAQRKQLPLLWNAPGVSEAFAPELASLTQWTASIPEYLAVRDQTSQMWLREAGVESPIHVVPDTAVEIARLWSDHEIDTAYGDAFARRQRTVPERTIVFHLNDRFAREAPEIIAGRLDRICRRCHVTGILAALGPCHGDSELQQEVGGRMATRPLVIDRLHSLREITACLARSEAYLGSSLHGLITACSFGRRALVVVPPGAGTLHKFTGFLEQFDLAAWRCESWELAEQEAEQLLGTDPDPWQRVLEKATPLLDAHWQRMRQAIQGGRESGSLPGKKASPRAGSALPVFDSEHSPPLRALVRIQAARGAEAVRALRRETQRGAQYQKATEQALQSIANSEGAQKMVEEKLALLQQEFVAYQRESEANKLDISQALQQTEASLARMENRARQAEESLGQLEHEQTLRAAAETRLRQLQQSHREAGEALAATAAALHESQQELVTARAQHEGQQRDLASTVGELTQANSALQASLQAAIVRHHQLEHESTQLREEFSRRQLELEQRIAELTKENSKFAAQLAEAECERRRWNGAQLEAQVSQLERTLTNLKRRLETAQKERSAAEARARDAAKAADYARLVLRVREVVDAVVRPGATVTVVSKGDDELLKLGPRTAWHFPGNERGAYLGYHPASATEAVALLEAQRMAGAEFLVIPQVFGWWLDHYGDLKARLLTDASCLWRDESCVIFEIRSRPLAQPPGDASPSVYPEMKATAGRGDSELKGGPQPHVDDALYQEVVNGVRTAVDRWVPADNVVAVVSKGDDDLLRFARHRGWHFPQTEQGVYTGYHPASDTEAIDHLESLRKLGVRSLVVPKTAWWWFEHYRKFGSYLQTQFHCAGRDEYCFVFDLAAGAPSAWTRQLPASSEAAIRSTSASNQVPTEQAKPSAGRACGGVSSPGESIDKPLHPGLVTVIIPVYNAVEDVRLCLASLLHHTLHPHQVLLIDDCSPDPSILPLLEKHAREQPHIHLVRNPVNRGFTGTVNRGCGLAPGDVVLLNSDTQVTYGWLEKLSACAISREHVATVTPVSNAAGAFSVPQNNCANEIPPSLTLADMGRLVERLSRKLRPEVPTGNGFCMYITRRALNIVGKFDEKNFPRGYGEENDFCMRAMARGFVNLIDDATFIHHRRSASFLDSRNELLRRSRETLRRLHPTYKREVTRWLSHDPLDPLRAELRDRLRVPATALSFASDAPCLLFVIHDGKGGTLLTNVDLMRELAKDYRCLVLKTALNHWTLLEDQEGEFHPSRRYAFSLPWQVQLPLDAERSRVLEDICRSFEVRLVHVRHLLGSGPEALETFHWLRIPVILSFHDYYTVCPTIQLIDDHGVYCGGRCTPGQGDCLVARSWFRGNVPVLKHQFVHEHRRRMAAALPYCQSFITTCESARATLQDAFPYLREADFRVIEHGRDLPRLHLATAPRPGTPARVVCLGNIDRAKGGQVIERLLAIDRQAGGRFEFHFVGNHSSSFNPQDSGGICHGAYQRDELMRILEGIAPSFSLIASIWPETYCHTLTESWAAGLPVFASNLGALSERIQRHGGGWLSDPTDADAWYQGMVQVLDSPAVYQKALDEMAAYQPRSVKDMARDYHQAYLDCFAEKESCR